MKHNLDMLDEILNNPDAKWEDVVNWKVHCEQELRQIKKQGNYGKGDSYWTVELLLKTILGEEAAP